MFTRRHCSVFKITLTRVSCMLHHILPHMHDIITPSSWNAFPDLICNEEEQQLMSKNLGSFVHISLKMQDFTTKSRDSVFLRLNPSSTTSKLMSPLPLVDLSAPAVGVQMMGVCRAGGLIRVREGSKQGTGGGLWEECVPSGGAAGLDACPWLNVGVPCCLLRQTLKRFGKCKTLSSLIYLLWKVVNFHKNRILTLTYNGPTVIFQ